MAEPIVLHASLALDAPGHEEGDTTHDAYTLDIGALRIEALDGRSIRTVAFRPEEGLKVEVALAMTLPPVGLSTTDAGTGTRRLLGVQRDQYWLLDGEPAPAVAGLWWVDQSDGWTTLAIEGESVFAVLERLCPIDTDADCFPIDSLARTVIEHLGVVVLRTDKRRFELLTPRSSVVSFAHAIEAAAAHVAAERELRASTGS